MKIVISLIVTVLFLESIFLLKKKLKYGASCCGTKEAIVDRIPPADDNTDHYPYHYLIQVEGMTCMNCARHIENAFHRTGEDYAKVNLKEKQVSVWFKKSISRKEAAGIIDEAGYTLMEFEEEGKK